MTKDKELKEGYEWRTTKNNYVPMIYCLKCEKKTGKPCCLGTNKSAISYHELEVHMMDELKKLIDKAFDEKPLKKKELKRF